MVKPRDKAGFRELARELRRLHAGDPQADFAAAVEAIPGFQTAASVAVYLSFGIEPDTGPVVARCHALGKRVGVPTWIPERREYGVCALPPGARLAHGPLGIPEPAEKAWTDIASYDLFIVPGLLFDAAGTRLGHGKGFYDRILAQRAPGSVVVALAFDWQLLEEPLPAEPHDVPMDYIATPTRAVRATGNEEARTTGGARPGLSAVSGRSPGLTPPVAPPATPSRSPGLTPPVAPPATPSRSPGRTPPVACASARR